MAKAETYEVVVTFKNGGSLTVNVSADNEKAAATRAVKNVGGSGYSSVKKK